MVRQICDRLFSCFSGYTFVLWGAVFAFLFCFIDCRCLLIAALLVVWCLVIRILNALLCEVLDRFCYSSCHCIQLLLCSIYAFCSKRLCVSDSILFIYTAFAKSSLLSPRIQHIRVFIILKHLCKRYGCNQGHHPIGC